MILTKSDIVSLKKAPVTPDELQLVFIDFETFWDTADGYGLRQLSMTAYINDPRYQTVGFTIKVGAGEPVWIWGENAVAALAAIDWSRSAVVAHNVKFDGAILAWRYGVKPALWIDTMGMAKAVFGSSMRSFHLKSLAEKLNLPPKGELHTDGKKEFTEDEKNELVTYGLRDLEITIKAFELLKPVFPANQWIIMDWTTRCFVEPKLELDIPLAEKIIGDIQIEKEEMLKAIGLERQTLSSNKKFSEYLESLGYKVPVKENKNGKLIPALAKGDIAFQEMLNSDDARLKAICEVRVGVKQTMEISRAKNLVRMGESSMQYPFDVGFSGALQTHRFSGGDGAGGNPQNFPKTDKSDLRYALRVSEGSKLLVADFKNIEWRILSFLARDPQLMEMIRKKIDPYCHFASRIYSRQITKADKKERDFGKEAVLGLGYQMGADTFGNRVKLKLKMDLSHEDAWSVVRLYRDTYTAVPAFWALCEEMILYIAEGREGLFPTFPQMRIGKQSLVLPDGLEIKFPNLRKQYNEERDRNEWVYDKYKSRKTEVDEVTLYGGKLTENICQALAGVVCKDAIRRLIAEGFPPVGQVHDELLVVCRDNEVEKAKAAFARAMEQTLPWWPELVLEAEIGVGMNWGSAKI